MFLWGSNGTGKTLLLIEVLRMKLAYYKLKGFEVEVIACTYHWAINQYGELIKNLKEKLSDPSFSEMKIQPKSFDQVCEGILTLAT